MNVELINGDCLEEMKKIPDGSVDMILCDLPYGTSASSWDKKLPMDLLWKEYKRIIKPNSSIVSSKISVGYAQKREKPTLKNANHNIVRRIDKNNISYESNYGIDWGEDN